MLVMVAGMGAGCLGPVKELYTQEGGAVPVYVVHRGIHAGLVVPREQIPDGVWRAHQVAPRTRFIEVGWGDKEGFRKEWTSRIVTRALFLPTPSAILTRGSDWHPTNEFAPVAEQIVRIDLSDAGFARMCAYFQSYYELDAQGRPIPLGEDFYLAKCSYHLFGNSNHWTARALREAGCPITPVYAFTVGNVMKQTRRFGRVIWSR